MTKLTKTNSSTGFGYPIFYFEK